MAESIALGAFLQVLFEKTVSLTPLVVGQFKTHLGVDVNKEAVKLRGTLETIQAVIEDAEKQQLKDKAVRLWLAKLKDAAYDVDDILDEFQWEVLRQEAEDSMKSKVRHFFSSENTILFHIRMGRRIKKFVEKLDLIAAERSKFDLNRSSGSASYYQIGSSNRTETHSFVDESTVVGREADKNNIVEMLISLDTRDCPSVLPIEGMGGLGKTTLAQLVYNDPRVEERFQLRMWVCVSDKFDVARLVEEIIKSATRSPCGGLSMDLLQNKLRETLSSKRYLLVLDDVWNEDAIKWEELRVLLSRGEQGSAIVVTTRSQMVSSIVGTMHAHNLAYLSEEDSWTLFKQRALGADEPSNLTEIGKKIVKKFGGLPLAAKTVGSFLGLKKEEKEWLSVLQSEIWDLPTGENQILPALRLSYDYLPSHLKQCFAYCAIFPKDYPLEKDVLIKLWMANGLTPHGGKMELEDKGHDIFNELVSRSFLQGVHEPYDRLIPTIYCNMHDLVHDLAQAIAKNECCCILEDKELGDQSVTKRHVSFGRVTTTIINKATLTFSGCMRTIFNLSSPTFVESPKNIWLKAKSLRVLDLSGTPLEDVPVSIDNLKHLRYLDLSHTDVETLPEATTRLFHLQTLKLEYCHNLCELPKGIKNLKNLRHLCIGGCDSLMYMPSGMGNLICLRTLSKYVVGSNTGSGSIRELKQLKISGEFELCGLNNVENGEDAKEAHLSSKHDLQSVTLRWDDIDEQSVENVEEVIECLQPPLRWDDIDEQSVENVEEVIECLQPPQNIKQLGIYCYPGTVFPNWMMMCATHLPSLVRIYLYNCSRCEHLPALGQLHSLEVLVIKKMGGVKYMGGGQSSFHGSGAEIFPSLEELKLYDMANLEEWVGWEVTGASAFFPRLVELEITSCPKMKTMPHLPSVQKLHVFNCPLLIPEKGFFLKMIFLKELDMSKCGKLAQLLSNEEVRDSNTFPRHLESLRISYCDELTSLSDEFMFHLSSLKQLEIGHCENLVGLSSLSSSSTGIRGERGLQRQYLTALKSLWLWNCEKLIFDQLELLQSPCLQKLRLQRCPNLRSLSEELQCLTALRELRITECENLVSLPDGLGCLTALETLEITGCPGITTLPELLWCLSSLRSLTIGSNSLLSLPQSLRCLTDLTRLTIQDIAWTSLPDCLGRLTALEYLSISQCTELTSLPEGLEGLTALRELEIIECEKLVSLPDGLGCLTALETLVITKCTGITTLPESLGCLSSLRSLTIGSNSLSSLPQSLGCLTDLSYLKIQHIAWASLPDCLGRLTALVFLSISQCTELTSLPEGLEGLTKLKSLNITDCPKLISLPESLQRQLPRLQSIYISKCPILQRKCATGGKYWRLVSQIPFRYIESLSGNDETVRGSLGAATPETSFGALLRAAALSHLVFAPGNIIQSLDSSFQGENCHWWSSGKAFDSSFQLFWTCDVLKHKEIISHATGHRLTALSL